MQIYTRQELKKTNIIQKLFGLVPSQNAMIEINNLFADHQSNVEKISLDQISEIANKYKVNVNESFKNFRLEIFRKHLHYCLLDSKLEDSEIQALKHLREILLLTEKETKNQIDTETKNLYKSHVNDAIADGRLDESEELVLERIKKDLLISEEVANTIYEENATELLQNFIDGAISDERLTPHEEKEMNEIAKSLGIDLKIDEKSKEVFDRYLLYWQIENSELPEIETDINLQESEKLHFKTQVHFLEQKRITKRINDDGPTSRIKLAKGAYYRRGSIKAQSVKEDLWRTIDKGYIYLTSKRLFFAGSKDSKTILINKITGLDPYSNGIEIQNETGKNIFLEFDKNVDLFSMIIARLMNEQS